LPKNKGFLTALLYTLAVLAVSLTPLPDNAQPPGQSDKLIHCLLYAVMYFLWARAVNVSKSRLMLFLAAFGLIIEILQGSLPLHRSFDWWDWAADIVGAACGSMLF